MNNDIIGGIREWAETGEKKYTQRQMNIAFCITAWWFFGLGALLLYHVVVWS